MFAIVQKWTVKAILPNGHQTVIVVHNDHLQNVLRVLAEMSFSENGLEEPVSIEIQRTAESRPSMIGTISASVRG